MQKIKITRKNLLKLLKTIRIEDLEEIKTFYKNNYQEKFLENIFKFLKNKNTIFVKSSKNKSFAIGGVYFCPFFKELKVGQIWMISSYFYKKDKIKLFEIIRNFVKKNEKNYDILFNFIYKSNFSFLKQLEKFDFNFIETKNKDYKLFYKIKKGVNFDIRHFTR